VSRPGDGKKFSLYTYTLLILSIAAVPVKHPLPPGVDEYTMLIVLWVALLYTFSMQSFRTTGHPVILFPAFQSFMAVNGHTLLQETAYFLATFVGMVVYTIRTGEKRGNILPYSARFTLSALLSLRLTAWILGHFRESFTADHRLLTLALVAGVLLSVFFNFAIHFLFGFKRSYPMLKNLAKYPQTVMYPSLVVLFLLPAAREALLPPPNSWTRYFLVGVSTILVIQTGLSLILARIRFSHSRTRFLEDELAEHSNVLTEPKTAIEVLRKLTDFWYGTANPEGVRITWKNVSLEHPTGFTFPEQPRLSITGSGGLSLEIWPTSGTTLDRDRADIFVHQAETVLKSIEYGEHAYKSGRRCLEAMVRSLDKSDSRQLGYSSIVAHVATKIGKRMGLAPETLEDLRMASMLHLTSSILEKAEEDWNEIFTRDPSGIRFRLPPGVVRGIRHMRENYDGTGEPDGLSGESIPIISRILSVASNFVSASDQSPEKGLLELERRAGLIYDPDIVLILGEISSEL